MDGREPAPPLAFIRFLLPLATLSLPVANCAVRAISSGGVTALSAVPGREFAGDPVREFGWVMAFGNEGCNMSPPEPEFIVRCGGRLGAPEAVDAAAPANESEGAGESGSAVFAAVEGRSPGVIGRRGIGSFLLIVCVVYGTGEVVGEGCRSSNRSC